MLRSWGSSAVGDGGQHRRQVGRGVDEADVGERLREVAELASARRRRTPRRAGRRRSRSATRRSNSASASSSRPIIARLSASQNEQGRNAPSPAGSPSTAPVGLGLVAGDEAVLQQRPLDRVDRADDAGVVAGQEADDRHHQHGGVEPLGAVRLGERVELGVEALVADLRRGSRRGSSATGPTGPSRPNSSTLRDGAVEREPGHHLRVGEVLARSAHLPDALVGMAPQALERRSSASSSGHEFWCVPSSGMSAAGPVQRGEDLAVHVELELLARRVADAAPASSSRSRRASRASTR